MGGPIDPPLKTLAVLHHIHRAQLPRICIGVVNFLGCSSYRGMLGVLVAVFSELNGWFTQGGQQKYLLMPAQRSNPYQLL